MSRHKCTQSLYKAFLQSSSLRYSGLSLSEVSPISLSHDSVSNFLKYNILRPRSVWDVSKNCVKDFTRPILTIDDSVLDKSRSKSIDLVRYQYSGNAHRVIAGIGLINLVCQCLTTKETVPVDFRLYDPDIDGKTKNDHFRDMLHLAHERGIDPEVVVGDAWYSSLGNLKAISSLGWNWVMGLKKNRKVNRRDELQNLIIPEEGLRLHLRGYGWITVFRFVGKNGRVDYIGTNLASPTRERVESYVKARWSIEVYHRELKQTCGIEKCQSRKGRAQRNHILMSVLTWMDQHRIRCLDTITLYQQKWDVIKQAITKNIQTILQQPMRI